ncbi:hypothetical protein ACFQPA_16000 [Halomarina halobia]|uniref:DUF4838 domain-containing protein n=1 Tax=Halomarina halobia TaxID=3033386 RepID=A0ABD6AET4_9EURY|nr:hypothetical protein [Halomarina sp. PSR21]
MPGIVTRNADELDWPEFDLAFYEVKDVTGRRAEPMPEGISMISCFGDSAEAESNPSLVPVGEDGERATRERTYFDWSYVCPTRPEYRRELLDLIERATAVNRDVRLDDVGFPRPEYCHCDTCNAAFADSDHDDRFEWRASVITDFVGAAAERIPDRVYMTLYPDPYPGHLYERAGIDVEALSASVDEFVVPLYDLEYSTTYWLEVIASGFETLLETPFSVELYAVHVETGNLVHATEVAAEYANTVLYAYEAGNAREVIEQMNEGDGVEGQ